MKFEGLTFVVQELLPYIIHTYPNPEIMKVSSPFILLVLSFLSCSHRINNNAQQRLQNTAIVASFTTITWNLIVKIPQQTKRRGKKNPIDITGIH